MDNSDEDMASQNEVDEEGGHEDDIICSNFKPETVLGRAILNKDVVAGIINQFEINE